MFDRIVSGHIPGNNNSKRIWPTTGTTPSGPTPPSPWWYACRSPF